jgi:hypothetical protein
MLYNSMLHNTLMYVTPCYTTCVCYVSGSITYNNTTSVYCCRLCLHGCAPTTRMDECPPLPEASESEHGSGSTLEYLSGSCWSGMITTSEKMLVEREKEVAVEQIHWLQCHFAAQSSTTGGGWYSRWVIFQEWPWTKQYRYSMLYNKTLYTLCYVTCYVTYMIYNMSCNMLYYMI